MKNIKELISERRAPGAFRSQSTIICDVDKLDELLDCFEKGIKAINFDLEADENKYHIITQFYDDLKNGLSRVGDKLEFMVRLAPDEKEGDR